MRFPCLRMALAVAAVSALSGCSLLIDADADRVGGPDGEGHQQDDSPITEADGSVGDGAASRHRQQAAVVGDFVYLDLVDLGLATADRLAARHLRGRAILRRKERGGDTQIAQEGARILLL